MDIAILTSTNFAIYPIEGTNECIVFYGDGTADRMTRREVKEAYGEVLSERGGSLDSPEKIQAAVAAAIENSVSDTHDFFEDEPPERHDPTSKKARTTFDSLG